MSAEIFFGPHYTGTFSLSILIGAITYLGLFWMPALPDLTGSMAQISFGRFHLFKKIVSRVRDILLFSKKFSPNLEFVYKNGYKKSKPPERENKTLKSRFNL